MRRHGPSLGKGEKKVAELQTERDRGLAIEDDVPTLHLFPWLAVHSSSVV